MARILLLNGPNLNLLGTREPAVYGAESLARIETRLGELAKQSGHEMLCFQSNAEHVLVDRIHGARQDGVGFILINPGALTHTSIVLRDALLGVGIPFIEVHISNVFARESFRHRSTIADAAAGCIIGFGVLGYELALEAASRLLGRS